MKTRITRRGLIRVAGLSGGVGLLAAGPAREVLAQQPAAPAQEGIEPITIKRRGVGFHGYDQARTFPGFTLFAPLGITNKTVYLIDLKGEVVHTWDMPYPPGLYGYLTERGTLFYNGKVPSPSQIGRSAYMGGAAMEGDRLIWWNFVASSRELIDAASQRWQQRAFEAVPGETEFIPLPERSAPR